MVREFGGSNFANSRGLWKVTSETVSLHRINLSVLAHLYLKDTSTPGRVLFPRFRVFIKSSTTGVA